jgi:hypothetical protein
MKKKKIPIFFTIWLALSMVFLLNPLGAVPQKTSSPFSQAKFVPDIALIVDFSYAYRNVNNEEFQTMALPGFSLTGIDEGFAGRGFNLNYAELTISAVVDPYFDLFTCFHLSEGEFEIEEAYVRTRSLPLGFQLKAGQFLSSFGRLNSQHDHYWNFSDQPLIYRGIFGESNLDEKGVQLNWVAPLGIFLQLGVEYLKGENEASFGTTGFQIGEYNIEEANSHLWVAFAKTSLDFERLILLGGISFASGKYRWFQAESAYGIAGTSRLWGGDLTLKYLIDSYRYISLQGEYIHRKVDARKYSDSVVDPITPGQSGLYLEWIWRFNRRWRWGARYDLIFEKEAGGGEPLFAVPDHLYRCSSMLEYNPTEFSRIRLQYNYDRSRYPAGEPAEIHEVFFQINLSIGAHGAHPF